MKVLLTSDLHGSEKGVGRIAEMVMRSDADIVTINGDITHFGAGGPVDHLLAPIPVEVLAVTGNCDTIEIAYSLAGSEKVTPLNGNIVKRHGWHFCGYSYQDRTIQEVLPLVPRERLILLTHVPPRGFHDLTRVGNVGDGNINEWAEENRPVLISSGHIHEAIGITTAGTTTFVNPGPARDGKMMLLELDEEGIVDIRSI